MLVARLVEQEILKEQMEQMEGGLTQIYWNNVTGYHNVLEIDQLQKIVR